MRILIVAGLVTGLAAAIPSFAMTEKQKRAQCELLALDSLPVAEVYILQVAGRLQGFGQLPKLSAVSARLKLLQSKGGADLTSRVLREFGLSRDEWKRVENLSLPQNARLGTAEFLRQVRALDPKPTREQLEIVTRLNERASAALERVRTIMILRDEDSVKTRGRMMSEQELDESLRKLTRDPHSSLQSVFRMKTSGDRTQLAEWRYRIYLQREKLRTKLRASITRAFMDTIFNSREIPERDSEVLSNIAKQMGTSSEDILSYFGLELIDNTFEGFVTSTIADKSDSFRQVINRRVFTAQRKDDMIKAIREANDVILFKLAENQDLGNFEEIERLAKSLDAPIIVAPAFGEVGLIPTRMDFLFQHPRVHIMIDKFVQLDKQTYFVNNASMDKIENPLVGLDQVFQPTDRLIVFHPKVVSKTVANGYYDGAGGFQMTTGSMSIPRVAGRFGVGMSTDFRAQRAAEMNRGLVVWSRRYRDSSYAGLTGGANASTARRVSYADEHYGNRAGLFDLNKLYTSSGVVKLKGIPAQILGDLHLGNTDPAFIKAAYKTWVDAGAIVRNPAYGRPGEFEYAPGKFQIGAIVLHDLIDGSPFNEHTFDRVLTRAIMDELGDLKIENHIMRAANFVNQIGLLMPNTKVIVPVDNHGYDWIVKALESGKLSQNFLRSELGIILRMMLETVEQGGNPYERLLSYYGCDLSRVIFMSNSDQYRIGIDLTKPSPFSILQGTEIGQHSHMGINGAKSISVKALLASYGSIVGGHAHTSAELGQSRRVGALTPTRQSYHRGPSTNDASVAWIYAPEAVQLLRYAGGSFTPNDSDGQRPEEFFPAGLPRLEAWPTPSGGETTDQYRSDPPVDRRPRR